MCARSPSPSATAPAYVRAAMNVTVHAAETSTEQLLDQHLPLLLRAAGDVSAEWALWQSRPHVALDTLDAAGATGSTGRGDLSAQRFDAPCGRSNRSTWLSRWRASGRS